MCKYIDAGYREETLMLLSYHMFCYYSCQEMNFLSTGHPNTERILCYDVRMKAKHKLKGPEFGRC